MRPAEAIALVRAAVNVSGGEVELALVRYLADAARVSVDIGASVGAYTVEMLRHSRAVYAFEPNPDVRARLQRSVPKAVVLPFALSDETGTSILHVPRIDSELRDARGSLNSDADPDHVAETITIARMRLDELPIDDVGLVKIDVEGHELEVLAGGARLLARDRPTLIIESEMRHGRGGPPALARVLSDHGYEGWFVSGTRLRRIEAFNAAEHQGDDPRVDSTLHRRIERVRAMVAGERAEEGRVNNFLFFPVERTDATIQMLAEVATLST